MPAQSSPASATSTGSCPTRAVCRSRAFERFAMTFRIVWAFCWNHLIEIHLESDGRDRALGGLTHFAPPQSREIKEPNRPDGSTKEGKTGATKIPEGADLGGMNATGR